MPIARVALDVPLPGLFDYLLETPLPPGAWVLVPFGRRQLVGLVWELAEVSEVPVARLKRVSAVLPYPALPASWRQLVAFCSRYYHHPLGATACRALPARLRRSDPLPDRAEVWLGLSPQGRLVLPAQISARAPVQQRLWQLLQAGPCPRAALQAEGATAMRWVRAWLEAGWLQEGPPAMDPEAIAMAAVDHPPSALAPPVDAPQLTPAQASAWAALQAQPPGFQVSLLHGVTGSGKTEIYLRLMEAACARGEQVLFLVPEINLTPQLEARVAARLPRRVVVGMHSGLADGERAHGWLGALRGTVDVVLGTRLAVLTPMPRLGLIVVDEEHDPSFKQQDTLRYHARDVAIARGRQQAVPVVLGSATPALETWYRATCQQRYHWLSLPQRAVQGAKLPEIRLLDTGRVKLTDGLAGESVHALRATLQRGEQSLVFLNRRGYSPSLACGSCGWHAQCHRCTAHLIWHRADRCLRCHHCGLEARVPAACPECGHAALSATGQGTQRIEQALQHNLPQARIVRVDRDSTQRKQAWPNLLATIQRGEADVLVGTQMLAKGHDFPNLALVLVVDADAALFAADFRSTERMFATLLQVSGRAGRASTPGTVLVQTRYPDHPLYRSLQQHDYPAFARLLLQEREQAGFPPYTHQAMLRAEAADLGRVLGFLRHAVGLGQEAGEPVEWFDPVPALVERVAGRARAHVLLQSASRTALQRCLARWSPRLWELGERSIRWSLDVDPVDLNG